MMARSETTAPNRDRQVPEHQDEPELGPTRRDLRGRARPVRIANISGFYGDRITAASEMLAGGEVDFLTGDYLAELTMYILHKARKKDPSTGYAKTFVTQMEQTLTTIAEAGTKVVVNAGGLNPHGLTQKLREMIAERNLSLQVAFVDGDDVLDRLSDLQAAEEPLAHLDTGAPFSQSGATAVTANAYLGAWPVVEALDAGVDIVVTGRITDAALTVAPAAWWHGWARTSYDELAGAVAAGHVIECGPQATGGNYPFLDELKPGRRGFPIAEVAADGSAVITKNPGTGGAVTVGTVTSQLVYEVQGPDYHGPDVIAWFDTLQLDRVGADRVRISGTRGTAPTDRVKVAINYEGGYRNAMTVVVTGLDIPAKTNVALDLLFGELGGRESFDEVDVRLVRSDRDDAEVEESAFAYLTVAVKDRDPAKVGRRFSDAVTELFVASFSGFFTTTPPSPGHAYGVYWPTLIPAAEVTQRVTLPDGEVVTVPLPGAGPDVHSAGQDQRLEPLPSTGRDAGGDTTATRHLGEDSGATARPVVDGAARRVPLGTIVGARSGDKGGNANVGIWVRDPAAYQWLARTLTPNFVRALVPEAAGLGVDVWPLPNLLGANIVIRGLLGEGVSSSTRADPQAKALGEYVRSRMVEIPLVLLNEESGK